MNQGWNMLLVESIYQSSNSLFRK